MSCLAASETEIIHGDSCPECFGVVVMSESEEFNDHELRCNECGKTFPP